MRRLYFLLFLICLLTGCSSNPKGEASSNGEVVEGPTGATNVDQLDQWMTDFQTGKAKEIRFLYIDDEGSADKAVLSTQKNEIVYKYVFHPQSGSNRIKKETAICKGIRTDNSSDSTDSIKLRYLLTDCDKKIGRDGLLEKEILIFTLFK
ncbi:hypothetical protein HGI30_17460 [Paenibacillus albicereus]|uniref:DUF4362 domain-containing protein n=1 Tax=Paenibacillus albicereus TaxID=2726185 RepID=A0A6H2H0G6_9BACL|nr:hypothetical protein [Paenibacillus albicereus]QJC53181.1 hypothetical protein HGI30_17460 [Paenibacillus albicereus]